MGGPEHKYRGILPRARGIYHGTGKSTEYRTTVFCNKKAAKIRGAENTVVVSPQTKVSLKALQPGIFVEKAYPVNIFAKAYYCSDAIRMSIGC